jgi:hypothetical protein
MVWEAVLVMKSLPLVPVSLAKARLPKAMAGAVLSSVMLRAPLRALVSEPVAEVTTA